MSLEALMGMRESLLARLFGSGGKFSGNTN